MRSAGFIISLLLRSGKQDREQAMNVVIEQPATLQIINHAESMTVSEWEELSPDRWLLIEVTREDERDVYEGKLIATAERLMEFVDLKKELRQRGVITFTTRGVLTGPQPAVIV
jgi:hypothetical protein